MVRVSILVGIAWFLAVSIAHADAFDRYTNPILAKAVETGKVREVKEITSPLLVENGRVLPRIEAAMIIVLTNEKRYAKLLAEPARQKVSDEQQVPMLLVERLVTFREGDERTEQARSNKLRVYPGFRVSLDLGQIVPPHLGGDIEVLEDPNKPGNLLLRPLGKARLFLLTEPLPEAQPKKGDKVVVVGDRFEPRYFNGDYRLYDDGRRSGLLHLEVNDTGEVSGAFYSDRDGQKYDVRGKTGPVQHAIRFVIQFPQTEQEFTGYLFTGDARAIAGVSKLQKREAGFYAVRVVEE